LLGRTPCEEREADTGRITSAIIAAFGCSLEDAYKDVLDERKRLEKKSLNR